MVSQCPMPEMICFHWVVARWPQNLCLPFFFRQTTQYYYTHMHIHIYIYIPGASIEQTFLLNPGFVYVFLHSNVFSQTSGFMKTYFFMSLNRSKSVGLSRVHNERTFAHRSAFSCKRTHFQDLHTRSAHSFNGIRFECFLANRAHSFETSV